MENHNEKRADANCLRTVSVQTRRSENPDQAVGWGVVRLGTCMGPVYIATDDYVAAELRTHPSPNGIPRVVLARSEIDAVLNLACQIAPPNYLRRTLWIELHRLVALKRMTPFGGHCEVVVRIPDAPRQGDFSEIATGFTGDRTPAGSQAGGPHGPGSAAAAQEAGGS